MSGFSGSHLAKLIALHCRATSETANTAETQDDSDTGHFCVYFAGREKGGKDGGVEYGVRDHLGHFPYLFHAGASAKHQEEGRKRSEDFSASEKAHTFLF